MDLRTVPLPEGTGDDAAARERRLRTDLASRRRVVVAFSGGIDSALLLKVAVEELGAQATGAIAAGPSLPARDLADALAVAQVIGARLDVLRTGEFEDDRYLGNGPDRCYWCRHALADALRPYAEREGADLLYGAVLDDLAEDRPGMQAAAAGGIEAPLLNAGFAKADVRALALRLGLPTWDKPASACLSSRVATGLRITAERLARVDTAEERIRALGFRVVRVRDAGDCARIEVGPDEIEKLRQPEAQQAVIAVALGVGFATVVVDPQGYRPAGLRARLPAAGR